MKMIQPKGRVIHPTTPVNQNVMTVVWSHMTQVEGFKKKRGAINGADSALTPKKSPHYSRYLLSHWEVSGSG